MQTILDNLGVPYSGINLSYSNSGTFGTADGEILVQLKEKRGKATPDIINELREKLPQTFPGVQFFFQPADIVTQILNFGAPAPIDVQITGGTSRPPTMRSAKNSPANFATFPARPMFTYNKLSISPRCTWISTAPGCRTWACKPGTWRKTFWFRSAPAFRPLLLSGSIPRTASVTAWRCRRRNTAWTPINRCKTHRSPGGQNSQSQILGNLVTTSTTARPAVVSHYNVQNMINVYSSVSGRDLGGVADK